MKSWTKKAVIEPGAAERLVQRMVQMRRNLGYGQEHAMEDAASALGTTPRRVRSFLRREVFHHALEEYRAFVHRQWADVDRQTAEITAMAIKLEKEAEAEWVALHQHSLPLDVPTSVRSSPNSASRSGGKRF